MKTKELDLDNIDPDFIISSFKTNGKPSVPVPASTEAIQAEVSRQPVEKVETNKPETDTGKGRIIRRITNHSLLKKQT